MFTDLEKQKIQTKLGNLKCPICGKMDMFYTDVPTHVISFPSTGTDVDFTKVSYMNCIRRDQTLEQGALDCFQ